MTIANQSSARVPPSFPDGASRRLTMLALCATVAGCRGDGESERPPVAGTSEGTTNDDGASLATSSSETGSTESGAEPQTTASSMDLDEDDSASTSISGEATSSSEVGTGADIATGEISTSDVTTGTGPSVSSEGTTTDASSTTSVEDTGDVGDPPSDAFPDPGAFGDDVQELDIVGTWGLNWAPDSGFDSVLDIDATGEFIWAESSADCATTTLATGVLWVEALQVVLHVETWERPLPWDTEAVLGETFPPPFRMRMSFSLQGGGSDAYLALAAPSRITEGSPYTGESYIRVAQQGEHLGGQWHGEAELSAVPAGWSEPVVIVRDYYDAHLEAEGDALDPQGVGTRSVTTQYFPVPVSDSVYDGANWTCLGGCPQPSGTTLVDGSNLYTYGPYGGQTHLLTFADDRTFRRDVVSDCR